MMRIALSDLAPNAKVRPMSPIARVCTRLVAGLVFAASLGDLGSVATADPFNPVTIESDLIYAKVGDVSLKLDLARPSSGTGPFPGLLVIHGGAWRAGNKADMGSLIADAAQHGYIAISPQYRFCPKETFPTQVYDVKAVVRWLRSHAKEYHLDVDHIGAMGFSAGGHLALMLGVAGPSDGLEGSVPSDAPSSRVQAVVNYFGPTDLTANDIPEVTMPLLNDFLGGPLADKLEVAKKASPLTMVTKDDPPILTFQGTKDPLVPHSQAIKLAEAQTRAGVAGRVELMLGSGHGWSGPNLVHTMLMTYEFMDRYLKPRSRDAISP